MLAAFAGGLVVGALGMLPGWWKHRVAAAQAPSAGEAVDAKTAELDAGKEAKSRKA